LKKSRSVVKTIFAASARILHRLSQATEAVVITMQQRGERHRERMAGVSERGVDSPDQVLINIALLRS
jgi:hypothetical protein